MGQQGYFDIVWQKQTPDFRDGDLWLIRWRRSGRVGAVRAGVDPLYFMPVGYEGPVHLSDYEGKVDWCLVWREEAPKEEPRRRCRRAPEYMYEVAERILRREGP